MANFDQFDWRVYSTPGGDDPKVREAFFNGMLDALEDWTQRANKEWGNRGDWQVKIFDRLEGDIYTIYFLLPVPKELVEEGIKLDNVIWKTPLALASKKDTITIKLKDNPRATSAPLILK